MTRPAPKLPTTDTRTADAAATTAAQPPAAPPAPSEEGRLASPLGDLDLHLIGEGRHFRLWEALGAQVEKGGVRFSVWAPNAREVRLIGDFNGWDRSTMPMTFSRTSADVK